jgi:dihydrofolate reductase
VARIQLYIAQSLDGYIADSEGGVEWLEAFQSEAGDGEEHGYADFLAGVRAVAMGSVTYMQLLSWDIEWPYPGLPAWIFTHRELPVAKGADIRFASGPVEQVVAEMERATEGNIWLVGGGALVKQFIDARLLDELILFVVPVLLGAGIPLFQGTAPARATLTGTKQHPSGLVELRYTLPR